nr:hypothetical protein [Tanacetum cinerariifolium]
GISDSIKADAEMIKEIKDDAKKAKLHPTSSSISVSLGFGDKFLKLSSDTSLIIIIKDTTNDEINSLLDIKIQSEIPHIHGSINNSSNTFICLHHTTYNSPNNNTNPYTIDALTITTTVPESNALVDVQLRVAKLEKDVSQMKKIDHSIEALAALKSQVLTVVEYDLRSKISHDLQKSASEIRTIKREQAEQNMAKYTIKSTDMVTLKDCDQKSALYQTIHENKSLNRNPANHALHYALMEDLIEDENAMDKGVANI